ncbi:MAG: hypothetical protein HFI34_10720 [Lachnospiraceae bacterium]|nr:hypothetical protein [Lachnospiraceae bacterium]
MTLPNEIKELLSAAYVDISTENVETVRTYNRLMETAIESGNFSEVNSYWNENEKTLSETILKASTINNIQNAILALENYIIEGKQTVKTGNTPPDDMTAGDIWIQTAENNQILAIYQWNGTRFEDFLIPHPEITLKDDSTSASSMNTGTSNSFSFTTIDNVTRDESGHVLNINMKTITIPKNIYMGTAESSNKFKLLGTLTTDGTLSNGNLASYSSLPNDLYFIPATGTIVASQLKGNAETASKISVSEINPSSAKVFYPTMVYNAVANDNSSLYDNKNIHYSILTGTTTKAGQAYLILGNPEPLESEENSFGALRLYGQNSYYASIYDSQNSLTANRTISVPNKNGIMAVTSDIKWDTLGYTPINPTSCQRITKYYNASATAKQQKHVTITFPCTIQGTGCHPRDLIRITAFHNTSSSSGVGTAILKYATVSGTASFESMGGNSLTIETYKTTQGTNTATLQCYIDIYPFGFLFIEASDECSVKIANSF